MVFVSTKVDNIGQQGNRALLLICIWQIIVRKAQQCRIVSASFRNRTDIVSLISFVGKTRELILQIKHFIHERNFQCNQIELFITPVT